MQKVKRGTLEKAADMVRSARLSGLGSYVVTINHEDGSYFETQLLAKDPEQALDHALDIADVTMGWDPQEVSVGAAKTYGPLANDSGGDELASALRGIAAAAMTIHEEGETLPHLTVEALVRMAFGELDPDQVRDAGYATYNRLSQVMNKKVAAYSGVANV